MYSRVKGWEGSLRVLGVDGAPLFPLAWINDLVVILGYDKKYLNLEEAMNFCLLGSLKSWTHTQ